MTTRAIKHVEKARLRAAGYGRLSKNDGTKTGLLDQEQLIKGRADSDQQPLDDWYADDNKSAYKKHVIRPEFQRMLNAIRAGEIQILYVLHLSRLVRRRGERAAIVETGERYGLKIVEVSGRVYDLILPGDRQMLMIAGEMDTAESEIKSMRCQSKAAYNARQGKVNGRMPYGWRWETRDGRMWKTAADGERIAAIDPAAGLIVAEICQGILAGRSLGSMATDLNERGVQAPGAFRTYPDSGSRQRVTLAHLWDAKAVRNIARRPANAGQRVHHDGRESEMFYDAEWPPIVSSEVMMQINALFQARSRAMTPKRDGRRRWLLSHDAQLGACGVCTGRLRASPNGRQPGVIYYQCMTGRCVARKAEVVDGYLGLVAASFITKHGPTLLAGCHESTAIAVARLREIDADEALTTEDYRGKRISRGAFLQLSDGWEKEREQLNREIERAAVNVPAGALTATEETFGPMWSDWDVTERRAVLKAIGVRIEIMPAPRGPQKFNPDLIRITPAARQ